MVEDKLIIFEGNRIRRVWDNIAFDGHDSGEPEWFFSVVDVVGVLTESSIPRRYWTDLKRNLLKEGFQLYEKIVQLKMESGDGKKYLTDCATKKCIFRIIQSIPSKKAEPFKLWLAKVGGDRIDEIDDPELSIDRAVKTYLAKGYSEKWINQRLKTIEVRKELTDEWKRVGVQEGQEFAILTNEITLAWSGKSIREYKNLKGLKKENLRDNMTNLELALNTLAEVTTTEISKKEDPEGFDESLDVAKVGGEVAGNARKEIEERLEEEIVSEKNVDDLLEEGEKEKIVLEEKQKEKSKKIEMLDLIK